MTAEAPDASRNAPCAAVGTTVFASGSPIHPADCVQWSEEGQVLLATADTLHILTPSIGYVDARPEAGAHDATTLSAAKALEQYPLPDPGDEECATLLPPVQRADTWIAAAWSPAGCGPHARCV